MERKLDREDLRIIINLVDYSSSGDLRLKEGGGEL